MTAPLISYYGDDFTGSTDVMEALASNGVATVLFLGVPSSEMRGRFKECQAIGIAGTSRSETPEWMQSHLTPAFEWLKSLGASICHYKVCSTFDSSPKIGNIGKAIEIGRGVFDQSTVPVIVGAPQLKRYTAFGNLFAAYQGRTFRIDRHPVMSRHPVTPMHEADLVRHLAMQTEVPVALADSTVITAPDADDRIDELVATDAGILMIDVNSADTQLAAGRQMLRVTGKVGTFVAGSSGVEYAIVRALQEQGELKAGAGFADVGAVDRLAVVSGSVSPTTERQIRTALEQGFDAVAVDPLALATSQGTQAVQAAVAAGREKLRNGRSVIVHTALGPSSDVGKALQDVPDARHRLSRALGTILRQLVEAEGLKRAVIAGGDTSSHALTELRVEALTTLLPLPQTPGSPLCVAHGTYVPTDGLQIALKGGQIGTDGYFAQIRNGRRS
ncbi:MULTISPECIES: four-carbon acid sugar kinase family protein [Rhizobium]|uniref:Uncharacterized conserved protein YgbK, DUF1537 family n=1 Tax=Rhizobium miluonense TaxID=411945 RepID=A0A1C3WWL6_9HYPH|nr:four-carbon acid sugar kinase family protein [Rhizobium miluonense]SCB44345.1 Uncharacterized conserved protein YgbK, DUF1537 family [Rhizobium miluonense]